MAVDIEKLLPIGTIVALEGAEKRLMVCGIKQTDATDPSVEYDYVGVVYPEGSLRHDMQFLFNHEDIATIFFLGYEDVERQVFISELKKFYENNNSPEKHE